MFTNGASSAFFSFSTLAFFISTGIARVFVDFAANFASFSNRLASFLAEMNDQRVYVGELTGHADLSSWSLDPVHQELHSLVHSKSET
jgi:hypothetical protein